MLKKIKIFILFFILKLSGNENDPLMDEVEGIDGELYLIGNRTLISLNLSSKILKFFKKYFFKNLK